MNDDTGGTCSTHEKEKTFIHILVRKPEEKRPPGKFNEWIIFK
jgi:hypothetical protein